MDTIIRKTRLRGREGTWDIGMSAGRIMAIAEHLPGAADLRQRPHPPRQVLPSGDNAAQQGLTFGKCLALTWAHKVCYTVGDILERADHAIREGILNWTAVCRAFAEVNSICAL